MYWGCIRVIRGLFLLLFQSHVTPLATALWRMLMHQAPPTGGGGVAIILHLQKLQFR
jgi:hypothetical protein